MSKHKDQQQYRGDVCAQEDFCKGCGNFDAFFNSCKLTAYDTSIQGKKETIHPVTNHSRWLLKIVGCASDTRHQQQPSAPDVIAELHAKVEEFKILSHDCNLDKKDCDYYKRMVVELEDVKKGQP